MAITLATLTLPTGLAWSDEVWTPLSQSSQRGLSGALIVQQSIKLSGRPITLIGQSSGNDYTAWITRDDLLALQTLLDTAGPHLLTLHDDRTFDVIARPDETPLDAEPLPVVGSFLPASPQTADWYVLRAVRLTEV